MLGVNFVAESTRCRYFFDWRRGVGQLSFDFTEFCIKDRFKDRLPGAFPEAQVRQPSRYLEMGDDIANRYALGCILRDVGIGYVSQVRRR